MSAEYVRQRYGINYKRGERLVVDGRHGVLTCFPDSYLGVRFDGDKRYSLCHPTWRVHRESEPPLTQDQNPPCRCRFCNPPEVRR